VKHFGDNRIETIEEGIATKSFFEKKKNILLKNPEKCLICYCYYPYIRIEINFRNSLINELHQKFSLKSINIEKKLPGCIIMIVLLMPYLILKQMKKFCVAKDHPVVI
jgi:hypothetical protein